MGNKKKRQAPTDDRPRPTAPVSAPGRLRVARGLEAAALMTLLLVIAMRPLLSETYDSGFHAIARAVDMPETTTPATTAWFGLMIWLSAVAVTAATALRGLAWRWTGIEVGWLLMFVAAALSTFVASNKRLALNASSDWLTSIVLILVLANLCRDRFRIALVLVVLAASGVASAAKCGMQSTVERAETIVEYENNKQAIWASQGVPLDDPQVEMFERRLRSREATGFFPFSNAQGAWLSLAGFAVLGLLGLKTRYRWQQLIIAGVAAALLASTLMAASRGAILAMIGGLVLWRVLGWLHFRLRRRWRLVLMSTWMLIVLAVAGVIMVGQQRGGLPGSSLNFRWQYWQVTRQVVMEHLWAGTGALNFAAHYMLHKPIYYPEEIDNPHNFVLAILAQWGIAGAAGLLLVLTGGSYVLARAWGRHTPEDEPAPVERHVAQAFGKNWILLLAIGFFLLRFWLLREAWVHDAAGQAMVAFDLGMYGVLWAIAAIGLLWLGNEGHTAEVDLYRMPVLCGLLAFLLANLIDFSLFYPGTLTAFAAMGGVLLARLHHQLPAKMGLRRGVGVFVAATAGAVIFTLVAWFPVVRVSGWLSLARHQPFEEAVHSYRQAAQADILDPTPWSELAYLYTEGVNPESLGKAMAALNRAIERDPDSIGLQRFQVMLLSNRYRLAGSKADLWHAIGAARKCAAMYPRSPDQHHQLAALLAIGARDLNSPELHDEAIAHYRQALELDDARPGLDEPRRWPRKRRYEIQQQLDALLSETQATPPAGATLPATRADGA